ncbi:TRAP transporter substrate-binding protein [Oceanobacillus longus]|uniref:TRAP transporter substrate-binding protein n=1 Tax=Oceanobacillus longus TaxID=930120 RepID=A0ABV8GZQ5_9BACI
MKKHNRIITIIMGIAFMLLLVACGNNETSSSEGEVNAEENDEQVYKLTMNSQLTPAVEGTPTHLGTVGFIERVNERTDGRVEIEVFYNNQLAGQSESLDALARGTIDFQVTSPVSWADRIPEGDGGNLPFAFQGEEFVQHLLRETEFGSLYHEALEDYGVKPLHYFHTASAGYLTTKPIASADDFSGVVLSGPSPKVSDYYSSLGAGVASVSFADYYEALLRGTIDGITFPYYSLETYGLHEVVDYITVPGEVDPALSMMVVSLEAWNKLPADLQGIVYDVAMEIEQETMELSKEFTKSGIEFARENGIEVIEMTEEAYNELRQKGKETYWEDFAQQNERTAKMVDALVGAIEEYEESSGRSYDDYLEIYR